MNKFQSAGASLASFALKRPVTVSMFFLSMLVFGLISSRLLPLEKFPGIQLPFMVIHVPYANATPEEVEKSITRPIEETLATMSGVNRLWSESNENYSEIFMLFSWGENIKAKSVEAREKIDAIRHLLPDDVERIIVHKENTADQAIFQMRISSERDLSNAYDLLNRNLKQPIERVKGVSRVALYGVTEKQISIRLDAEKITALHVDTAQLTQTLRNANFSMTAGSFFDLEQKITVNPTGEYKSIQEIEDLLVTRTIRLKNIATVTYEKPERVEGRHLDQTFAIGLDVFRESGANLVNVSDNVLKVVEEAKSNPAFRGINILYFNNEAKSVTSSLSNLLNSGLIGALLSVIVLYFFLRNISSTLIVVLSVPFSICITLGVMYLIGYTLNILSMMGLMLAVGMLVDNAVVVTESIEQEKVSNTNLTEATKSGVAKVSLAVIAGTATTAIVFLPNIVGVKIGLTIFLEHVAIAICISLFASLLLAQTLIPLLTSKIKFKPKPQTKVNKPSKFKIIYKHMLESMLKNQGRTALIAFLLLASAAIPMSNVSMDGDGDSDGDRIWLNYDVQGNYTLEEVEKAVTKMETFLYANQERFYITQVYTYYTPGSAVSGITLNPDFPGKIADLKKEIKEAMPSFVRINPSFEWDGGNDGGVRLLLLGQSSEVLSQIADNVVPVLAKIKGFTDVKTESDSLKKELRISIDRQKAFRFGLDSSEISNIVSTALRGTNLRTFRHSVDGEVDIRLMYEEEMQHSVENLKNLTIKRDATQNVTLDMVANLTIKPVKSKIQRQFRQTSLSIGANLEEGMTTEQAKEKIEGVMQHIQLPSGYHWTLGSGFQRQDEEQSIMTTNMLLAVCMIYIVMAALFESLLLPTAVITSLLFSFTGVYWTFFLTGTPMSIMGMIGMLILMGIVVNNGIVLVDRINQLIDTGWSVQKAIIEACLTRSKPILMTVGTTVLGLVPLTVGGARIGGDGPAYSPMAIAIIGGLVFSTATSLVLIPYAYLMLLKLRAKTGEMMTNSKVLVARLIKA
ncbi:efflux RND transporter permease subunit [Alteromonas sp. 5E99-2]|uniref:efflux RND transporter permease subunit n=1 Tax=Alteromonas sp. 5E99-2 TaxID=2817683 RepID=UPI001A98FAA3|nr:efflux RND transporter permease subunit [Alteromonas sp. 5E99-2]MBO1255675.1 efflux RND transporter permease subunit [Alteromonas sp. 5E99-2]